MTPHPEPLPPFPEPQPPEPHSLASTTDGESTAVYQAGTENSGTVPAAGLPLRVGAYEVVSELGRGGMGVVYKARDPRLNRVVAVKMVLAGEHAGAAERARFQVEAEA